MASGDTLLSFNPLSNSPPDSGYATLDLRGGFVVLDLDDSTDEQAIFHAVLPSHYGGGQVQANAIWTTSNATSGDVKMKVEVTRIQSGDNLDSLPTAVGNSEFTASAPTTSGVLVVSQSAAIATGSTTAGEILQVSLTRLASDVADTLVGDIELVSLELREV